MGNDRIGAGQQEGQAQLAQAAQRLGIEAFGLGRPVARRPRRLDGSEGGKSGIVGLTSGTLVNQGVIRPNVAGGSMTINMGSAGSNIGVIDVQGDTASVTGTFTNLGSINVNGGGMLTLGSGTSAW